MNLKIYQNIEQFVSNQNRKKSIPSLIFVIDLFVCRFWRRFTVSISCSKSIKYNLIIYLLQNFMVMANKFEKLCISGDFSKSQSFNHNIN